MKRAYTNITILDVAKVCHYANKAYCECMGDFSQVDWKDAPESIKASVIDGVEFHINNPEAKPSSSHENWLKFKKEDGWIYGEEKDLEKKTHPCMVPFDQLPPEQKAKDALFKYIVDALRELIYNQY